MSMEASLSRRGLVLVLFITLAQRSSAHRTVISRPSLFQHKRMDAPRRAMPRAGLDDGEPAVHDSSLNPRAALVLLNAVVCVWGTQHAVIKDAVQQASADVHSTAAAASALNLGRFATAGVLFTPFLPSSLASPVWRFGAELGVWMFIGFACQSIGLEFTTASRSAFLLYLNVKLVPLLSACVYRTRVPLGTWASAATAFAGTVLLCADGSPLNVGDAWSVVAALASACFILRLQRASARCPSGELNAATLVVVATLCVLWSAAVALVRGAGDTHEAARLFAEQIALPYDSGQLGPIIYLGAVCTGACNWAQTVGQRSISAERAAIIYATDPLWAAGFSWLWLGEELGPRGLAGAALIFGAAVTTQLSELASPCAASAAAEEVAVDDAASGSRGVGHDRALPAGAGAKPAANRGEQHPRPSSVSPVGHATKARLRSPTLASRDAELTKLLDDDDSSVDEGDDDSDDFRLGDIGGINQQQSRPHDS